MKVNIFLALIPVAARLVVAQPQSPYANKCRPNTGIVVNDGGSTCIQGWISYSGAPFRECPGIRQPCFTNALGVGACCDQR
jgi:hypothetical protein